MFYDICHLFMIFFIASIMGYLIEISFCSIRTKKLILNRGFLIGPYIPIYGVGTILVVIFLYQYASDLVVFFCMTVILCSLVEYITSYIMEKIFKVRWWDYSSEPFNYNGRVCLRNSILFGLAGILVAYTVYPFLLNILSLLSPLLLEIMAVFFFLLMLTDVFFTTRALIDVRSNLAKFRGKDITDTAHEVVMKRVKKHNYSVSRVLQAFPYNENFNIKEFKLFKDAVIDYRNKRKNKKEDKI